MTVDEYIAGADPAAQPMLRDLRAVIRAAVPRAMEKISYGMPYYEQDGRRVAYFAAFKRHVGLYGFGADAIAAHGLQAHLAAKSTLRFPIGEPLPLDRIRAMVAARA